MKLYVPKLIFVIRQNQLSPINDEIIAINCNFLYYTAKLQLIDQLCCATSQLIEFENLYFFLFESQLIKISIINRQKF